MQGIQLLQVFNITTEKKKKNSTAILRPVNACRASVSISFVAIFYGPANGTDERPLILIRAVCTGTAIRKVINVD